MMEAFMEEVVGYVFHLDVEVQETPTVAVVTDSDGQPIQVGAGQSASSPNSHDRAGRHLVESGPDPDGPGVAVHAIDEDDSEPDVLAEEPIPAVPRVKARVSPANPARVPRSATQLRRGRLSQDYR